jgi:hypothetical protein
MVKALRLDQAFGEGLAKRFSRSREFPGRKDQSLVLDLP